MRSFNWVRLAWENLKKTDYIFIRVSPEEKARWKSAADKLYISLSDYIRLCVNGEIRPKKPTDSEK